MEQVKEIKKRFLREVEKNNICISENPKGTDIFWPKSFANLYYQDAFCKIYAQNKSPVILQINESNEIIHNLWIGFFKNPVIKNEFLSNNQSLIKFKASYTDFTFDIVIIKNYKRIADIYYFIDFLKSKLKKNGIIIIENINFDIKFVTKLFLRHACKIFDFRFNRFLIDNSIIEIKRNSPFKNTLFKINYMPRYIFHLLVELVYYSLYILNLLIQQQK
ncbi:hypothetical protein [Prochlorococcus marinus]|uniref:hypothetical protein n=1 Tax=Prochlorococcus marinus TaxID=1219 RepID=UPI000515A89E|nr:hypothetical protein [Prochlorococcus marinus]KGF91957.1 hypothetical protein EU92_0256 [Prochlorococcus marinus str. MIT 9107]